ncbi:MAG: outer membrane beta-barrel protein [Bacteroidota bacterium]|nr:outer membrane beta-barrel protein [Bacteroidota bacterium]
MKLLHFFLIVLLGTSIYAQKGKFSATASYPLTFGDNFFDRNDGVIDLGVQYRFIDAKVMQVGIGFNAAFFKYENEAFSTTENVTLLQPKVLAELDVPALKGFKPFVGIGYGAFMFRSEFDNGNEVIEENDDTGGINVNLGLAKDIAAGLFVHVQYDYLNIERSDTSVPDPDDAYYKSVSILKLGIGFRF